MTSGRPDLAVGVGWPHRAARMVVVAAVVVAGLLVAAGPASAHAALVATSPTDGAVWDSPPTEIRLEFDDPVSVPTDGIQVLDRHGERVDIGEASTGTGAEISVGLRADLSIGTYVVTWRAVSQDSHPVSGAFVFSVGVAGAVDPPSPAPPPADPGLAAADVAVRAAWYLGGLTAVGGVVFLLAVRQDGSRYRRGVRRVTLGAALVGVAATALSLPLQAGLAAGTWSSAIEPDAVLAAAAAPFGAAVGARVGGLALVVGGLLAPHPAVGRWVGGVGAVLTVASVALTGHALTTAPRAVAVAAYVVHAAGAAIWFGGLVALAICLRRARGVDDDRNAARMAVHYSALAAAAVTAIGVAGLTLAYLQVETLDGLLTGYGRTLLLKVGMVVVAGAFGWYNRTRLISVLRRRPHRRHLSVLRRLVTAEAATIAVVLLVTAVLTTLEPPQAQAAPPAGPVSATLPIGERTVQITVDPARVGINTVRIAFTDGAGRPVQPDDEVRLELSLPDRDIAQISRVPVATGLGTYEYQGPELSLPGRWRVEVQVRTSAFTFDAQHVDVPLL